MPRNIHGSSPTEVQQTTEQSQFNSVVVDTSIDIGGNTIYTITEDDNTTTTIFNVGKYPALVLRNNVVATEKTLYAGRIKTSDVDFGGFDGKITSSRAIHVNAPALHVRDNPVTTTRTAFDDDDLVPRRYVDDLVMSGGSLVDKTPRDLLTLLDGLNRGVENRHFFGKVLTFTSAQYLSAGRVVSITPSSDQDVIRVAAVDGGKSESATCTQPIGITLNDCEVYGEVRVAVSGICSVLVGIEGTFWNGSMLTVAGPSEIYKGTVSTGPHVANNTASIGVCLSAGSKKVHESVLCHISPNFESY